MLLGSLFLVLYFIIVIGLDFLSLGKKRATWNPFSHSFSDEVYFLSGRKMSSIVLLISTAATNFSAFTILGLSGAGYRIGYAFYPVMAFGTGFMALGMYIVGAPLGKLSRQRGYITPADYIRNRYGSEKLAKLYSLALLALTLPYLALQPMSAGIILEAFFGIPYRIGVIGCSIVVGLYTTRGGMRAVVRTDLIQGVIILILVAAAYGAVIHRFGGFHKAHALAYQAVPELFSRRGSGSGIGFGSLVAYMVLWFFADPLFPQLNQRLLAAKDLTSLKNTVTLYPLVTMVLFFLTISMGVIGAGILPNLPLGETDRIWPLLIGEAVNPAVASLFMIAPLSAIMSTLDSQLLSLSSIITRDIMGKKNSKVRRIKIITALISLGGLLIALYPPMDILEFISKSSFLGYAALSPLLFGGLYGKRQNTTGALSALVCGEALVLISGLGLWDFGSVPPVFIVCGASWIAMICGSYVKNRLYSRNNSLQRGEMLLSYSLCEIITPGWAMVFIIIFIGGCDFFNYFVFKQKTTTIFGLPIWVLYQAGLCLVLFVAFLLFSQRNKDKNHGTFSPNVGISDRLN